LVKFAAPTMLINSPNIASVMPFDTAAARCDAMQFPSSQQPNSILPHPRFTREATRPEVSNSPASPSRAKLRRKICGIWSLKGSGGPLIVMFGSLLAPCVAPRRRNRTNCAATGNRSCGRKGTGTFFVLKNEPVPGVL
jgi:hypothetical protein